MDEAHEEIDFEPPGPLKKAHELWADDAGMLPMLNDHGAFGGRLNPKFPPYAAGRAFKAWPEGFEVTREEFEAAIKEAGSQLIR